MIYFIYIYGAAILLLLRRCPIDQHYCNTHMCGDVVFSFAESVVVILLTHFG